MIAVSLLAPGFGTLRLPAGFRTFPEIAALVGETPTEVRCDPKIAHRAAFVSAKAISREGLVRALRLVVVEEGDRRVLRARDAELEREWAGDLRRAMERQYVRFSRLASAAAEERAARGWLSEDDPPATPSIQALGDPNATLEARERAIDESLAQLAWISAEIGAGESFISTLGEFPSEIPPALVERGHLVDVRPFSALSPRTLKTLARSFPKLQGGTESLLVRRRTLGRFEMRVSIGIVDPAGIVAPRSVVRLPSYYQAGLLGPDGGPGRGGIVKLRRFATEIAARRSEEGDGPALVGAYAAEVPPTGLSDQLPYSLSNLVQRWAERGRDVIQELDPESEWLAGLFDGVRMRPSAPWSPTVVEGVLVLRPLVRFVDGARRLPYRALFALEAAGETPEGVLRRTPATPSSESMARYIAFAGSDDRWLTTPYRGWHGRYEDLDRAAAARRVLEIVPAPTLDASARVLRQMSAKPNPNPYTGATGQSQPEPVAVWTHRASELSAASQEAVLASMRAFGDEGNIVAFSPAASRRFLDEAVLEVRVQESYRGFVRDVRIAAPGSKLFAGAGLYGR